MRRGRLFKEEVENALSSIDGASASFEDSESPLLATTTMDGLVLSECLDDVNTCYADHLVDGETMLQRARKRGVMRVWASEEPAIGEKVYLVRDEIPRHTELHHVRVCLSDIVCRKNGDGWDFRFSPPEFRERA